jgi:tryptophan 2,3-dioxygenase
LEATRDHIWRIVEVRFGVKTDDLPTELRAIVREIDDLEQASQWFHLALTANSFEEFRAAVLADSAAQLNQSKSTESQERRV